VRGFVFWGAVILAATPFSHAVAQDDTTPWLWAAPALYGFETGACTEDGTALGATRQSAIAPLFCPTLGMEQRMVWGGRFADLVRANFPQVENDFGSHLPADASAQAKLRSSLVASLRLTRAMYSIVRKPVGIDAYLPLTLTLDITNPATGEVVFTKTRNSLASGTYSEASYLSEVLRQFPQTMENELVALVRDAAKEFQPYTHANKVVGKIRLDDGQDAYVLDAGRNGGLRTGSSVGSDGTVIFSGPDYAVFQSVLTKYEKGDTVRLVATAPVETLARPSILTFVVDQPAGYSPEWLTQIIEDEVGGNGTLSPVPVNPAFVSVRRIALNGAGNDLPLEARSLPDYIATTSIVLFDPVKHASDIPGTNVERYEAAAFITLSDVSGRTVGTWRGSGLIEDHVTAGIRLPPAQRNEAVIRNAIADAAKKMRSFRRMPQFVPISRRGEDYFVSDRTGGVPLNVTLPVLRRSGRIPGISEEILVPVGSIRTTNMIANDLIAINAGVGELRMSGREYVALESAGRPTQARKVAAQCRDSRGGFAIDDRGRMAMHSFAPAALSVASNAMPAPVRNDAIGSFQDLLTRNFAEGARLSAIYSETPEVCFLPVIAVVPSGATYAITVGFSLHEGADSRGPKLTSSGFQTQLTPTAMPPGTDETSVFAMLQSDLAREILPLAERAAAAIKFNSDTQ
jgi:hypothetical protein